MISLEQFINQEKIYLSDQQLQILKIFEDCKYGDLILHSFRNCGKSYAIEVYKRYCREIKGINILEVGNE